MGQYAPDQTTPLMGRRAMDNTEIRAPSFFDGLERAPLPTAREVWCLTKIECWPQLFSHFCLKKSRSLPLPLSLPPFDSADSPLFPLPSLAMNGKLKLNFSSFLVSPVAVGQPNRQGKLPRGDLHSCRRRRVPPSSSCRVAFVGNSGRCRGDGAREIKR